MADPENSPLDELFIVGARYHEPSAAERAAAAKKAEKAAKEAEKQRQKEIAHTKRVLQGKGRDATEGYDKRTAIIGALAIVALAVALSQTAFGH